jgi:hypothetical protein
MVGDNEGFAIVVLEPAEPFPVFPLLPPPPTVIV